MVDSKKYPRVLVVSSSVFNKYAGTGVTLSNLFRNWPKDSLAMVHSDALFAPDDEVCDNYFYHGYKNRKIIGFHLIINIFIQIKSKISDYRQKRIVMTKPSQPQPVITVQKDRILNSAVVRTFGKILGDIEPFTRINISQEMEKWIVDFNPEIIYSPISTISNMEFVLAISDLTSSDIAVHFMDDWPSVKYRKGLMAPFHLLKMRSLLNTILKRSKIRIAIGQSMCDEYKIRYGYKFIPFSNPEESLVWDKYNSRVRDDSEQFKILYIGTFNSKNIETISKLSGAVSELFSEGRKIQMEIYSFQPRVELHRNRFEKKGCVTVNEVPESIEDFRLLLCSGDMVVIPLDYTDESIERMRLSFFTKIPAYMLCGSPILLCGPEEIGVVVQAKEEGWAYVVSEDSIEAVKAGIVELMDDPLLREKIILKSMETAIDRYDAKVVREKLRVELAQIT